MDAKQLIALVNQLIGEEALTELYRRLSDEEFNELQRLMARGRVGLLTEDSVGFTVEMDDGTYSSDGFVK